MSFHTGRDHAGVESERTPGPAVWFVVTEPNPYIRVRGGRHGKAKKEKSTKGESGKAATRAKRTPRAATAGSTKGNGGGESAGAPKKIKNNRYEEELFRLQVELVKMVEWIKHEGLKVVVIFEGRDAAGKGGVIKRITQHLSPRICRVVALPAPTEREQTQWYFQRYVPHLPAAGEMVLFDRSWYNRAGVERVMGFCTDEEHREFLRTCPEFERMLVRSGIKLVKYWFSVSDEEQEKRFQSRIAQSHKRWKLSPMDLESRLSLGRVLQGEGRDVRAHRHQASAVVRGRCGREEACAAELHQPSAQRDLLRGSDPGAHRASAAGRGRRIRAAPVLRPDAGSHRVPVRSGRLIRLTAEAPNASERLGNLFQGHRPGGRTIASRAGPGSVRRRILKLVKLLDAVGPTQSTDSSTPSDLTDPTRGHWRARRRCRSQSSAQVRKPAKTSRRSGPKKLRYRPVTMRERVVHAPPRSTRVWPNSVCEYSL